MVNKHCNRHIAQYCRSKGSQKIFGQLIEDNMRNIFLEKLYTKCCRETSPKPFSEKLNLSVSPDEWPKILQSLFLFYAKLRAIKIF